MNKKLICPNCRFVFEGEETPERCPQCKQVVEWKSVQNSERKDNGYPSDKPIDQWTRQECEAYLAQYPKSLKSDAVRKQYEVFLPEIQAEKKREEERKKEEEKRRKEEMERKEREKEWEKIESERIKKNWITEKKVIKSICIVACVGLGIFVIIKAITTEYKITFAGVAPLIYAINRLLDWNVEE